jgi:hypothetical protein
MFFAFLLAIACQAPGDKPVPAPDDVQDTDVVASDTDVAPPADTRRPLCVEENAPPPVAADLAAWADSCFAGTNRFVGQARLAELEALGEDNLGTTDDEVIRNRIERGYQRLRQGFTDAALTDLTLALNSAEFVGSPWLGRAREILAIAWMRRAELDNCVLSGTGNACLAPFSPDAVHTREQGMTQASALWTSFLYEDDPYKPGAWWLLNVCAMALGTFPDGVDPMWRAPDGILVPEETMPAWTNVAPGLGLAVPDNAGTSALDDFDGDGRMDVLFTSHNPHNGMRLYLNQGDGHFCKASNASGLAAIPGVLGASVDDFDNDGDLDIAAPHGGWYGPDAMIRMSLLQNDGEGRFTDVAVAAGVHEPVGPSQVAAWADVDGDGWLDLFVGRERAGAVQPRSSLYMNQRDGTFEDVAVAVGVASNGFVKGAAWGDFDNDGDPDLYVSGFGNPNHLYRNDRDSQTFTDVTRGTGTADPLQSFSTWWFDYDQDGWLDLFVTAYPLDYGGDSPLSPTFGRAAEGYVSDVFGIVPPGTAENAIVYHNLQDHFERVQDELTLNDVLAPMGTNIGDFDMDGWPDIYMGTGAPAYDAIEPNIAYHNVGGTRFTDVTTAVGMGHLQKGHGVSFGDLDDDGDEDILADIGGAYTGDAFPDALFLNPTTGAHGVTLQLEGTTSSRTATGARVRIVTPERTFYHVVGMASSFGNNSHPIEAGLGQATTITQVEIDWPLTGTQIITGVPLDEVVVIHEGEGMVASRPWARIPVAEAAAAP